MLKKKIKATKATPFEYKLERETYELGKDLYKNLFFNSDFSDEPRWIENELYRKIVKRHYWKDNRSAGSNVFG